MIIGGDSLPLERHVPRVQQDFPAGLVCRVGWYSGAPAAVRGLAGSLPPERGRGWVRGRAPSSPLLHAAARPGPTNPL